MIKLAKSVRLEHGPKLPFVSYVQSICVKGRVKPVMKLVLFALNSFLE